MLRLDLALPLYPVEEGISLGEFERRIMGEPFEAVGVFGADDRLALAPKSGAADQVDFIEEEAELLRDATITHNHPDGSVFSHEDAALAASHRVEELRAVCPDGVVYTLRSAERGWPDTSPMLDAFDRTILALRAENERRRRSGASILGADQRGPFMFPIQQAAFARIGVKMGRTDLWRR